MMSSMEDRLTRLEEQNYFQEQALAELNQALTRQQFQLDETAKRLIVAEEHISALLRLLEEGGKNTAPPHYGTFT